MSTSFYLKLYVLTVPLFFIIDLIWLGVVAKGFFTYATYDLTKLAPLKDWPLRIVFVDILWGGVHCSTVATLSFYIAKWLL